MERILIIGCPCAGKTTLARALSQRLGLPLIHLDQLWWTGDWKHVTREEFDSRLAMAVNMDRWIIDGNYSRTIPMRLPKCDTIIYLDFDRWTCLRGMVQRMMGSRGRQRPDMGGNCKERFDWEFAKYIWKFNKNNRVQNYTWIAQAKHAKAIVLKNRKQVKHFLECL